VRAISAIGYPGQNASPTPRPKAIAMVAPLEAVLGAPVGVEKEHFISVGTVQFGPGVSIAPIEIEYQTWTNKAGVQEGKDRGMAPLAWRFVRHAIYTMPFFVNPLVARKSGCSTTDIDLMKFLIPFAYSGTASVARPDVVILHAWYAEHKTPLGSSPDHRIIDAMTPKKRSDRDQPSSSIEDYDVPSKLPDELRDRLASFEDLCQKDWVARSS
jgi:CRISPR-associated protein Csd2